MEKEHWSLRIGRPLVQLPLLSLMVMPIGIAIGLVGYFHPEPWSGISAMLHDPLGIIAILLCAVSAIGAILNIILLICLVPRIRFQMRKDREMLQAMQRELDGESTIS